jgi:hypothetical protein
MHSGSECDHLPEAGNNNYLGSECDHLAEAGNNNYLGSECDHLNGSIRRASSESGESLRHVGSYPVKQMVVW